MPPKQQQQQHRVARKYAPRIAPPPTAHSPGKALVGMKVAQKFVEKRRSGFNLGAVVGHRKQDKLWGETYDVMLDTEGLDAGMTPEELLLILADDEDKRKAVAAESWTLARHLTKLRYPEYQVANHRRIERVDDGGNDKENELGFAGVSRYAPFVGCEELVHEDGTDCYQARVRDARGREHHFAFHFPTRWGAAAAHDLLARRLDYYGPGCAAGTARNFATDVSWDRLVGVLIAGATWTGPSACGEGPVVVPEGPVEEDAKKGATSDAPATATTANGAAGDVGRRIAVLWKSERRYFAGNVAAYDAVNGKHHVRYDDGDGEWIALSRHDVKWDVDAEAAEPKKKAGAKRPAAGRKRKADAAEDAPETSDEDEEEEEDDDDDDYDEEDVEEEEEEEPSPYNGKRQTPTKSARKVAPVPPRNPRQPAHSPCMRLVCLTVEKESIWQGDHGPTRGVVTGFHESVRYWGETFDVLLDENHLDAGLTFEELLLILANESDKERSVSDESWALAMGLLRLDDPGSSRVVRQFRLQYPQYFGFDRVGETEGKYEAKILDKKGMLHHFAYHFTTKWAAAAAHEILARRLEFHGPGVMRGTRRNFKPDAPWDALVGVLIAGAEWRPSVRSNEASGDDRAESDAADRKRSEALMSFIKWDHRSGRLRLAA